jgi:hypothetical protein
MLRASLCLVIVPLLSCTPEAPANVPTPSGSSTDAPQAPPKAGKTTTKTLFVADALVDCEGEGPTKCMRTRASEGEPWTLFYGRIEGFTYEEGNAYELRVEVTEVPNPPADAPSLAHRLVEVVSKKKAR